VRGKAGDLASLKMDVAAIGFKVSGNEVEQGGFSSPVGTDKTGDRPLFDPERAPVDGLQAAESFGEMFDLE
jgi:hypothetical protein